MEELQMEELQMEIGLEEQTETPEMESTPNEITLEYATLRYEAPIVYITFKENVELGFPETRELISCSEKLSEGKPYLVLSDARASVRVTPEGRRIAADVKEAPLHRGSAVLLNSILLKSSINFFTGFTMPAFPFRIFTEKTEAVDWLLKLPVLSLQQNS